MWVCVCMCVSVGMGVGVWVGGWVWGEGMGIHKQHTRSNLVPRLSPRMNENRKERGEPGKIYYVRNVRERT